MIAHMAEALMAPTCTGGCGLSKTRHREGCIFMGVIHFAERRFSRRTAKNYLMLVARLWREGDPDFLNDDDLYDWLYIYLDSTEAARLAVTLGFRIPGHLFNPERRLCALLAQRRGVKLSRRRKVYQWATA
jgi:hypothetical protein